MKDRADILVDALHISVLCVFGIAQPVLSVLGSDVGFFVARGAKAGDPLIVVGTLCLVLPVLLISLEVLAAFAGSRVRQAVHISLVAALVAIAALPSLKSFSGLPGGALVAFAAAVGLVSAALYNRFKPFRSPLFIGLFLAFIVTIPAVFLLRPSVAKLRMSAQPVDMLAPGPDVVQHAGTEDTAVILIVFDEFSTASLLDRDGGIDADLFPNFARLASQSHWFRNATTVSPETLKAVPAILSGVYPAPRQLATVADYPVNLFTLLGGSWQVRAFETVTNLCPEELCEQVGAERTDRGVQDLVEDVFVVSLHVFAPQDWRQGLPSIGGAWGDFLKRSEADTTSSELGSGRATTGRGDRRGEFLRFVQELDACARGRLTFIHSMLPHVPYQFLSDGSRYETDDYLPGWLRDKEDWKADRVLVEQAEQRYLLQVQFVDHLVGLVLDRLEETAILKDALLVITADHGVSFEPGNSRRGVTSATAGGVLPVPLFLRLPDEEEGYILDRNVETIDILPTIAGVLGVELPDVDGRSLLEESVEPRLVKTMVWGDTVFRYSAQEVARQLSEAVARKLDGYGRKGRQLDLYRHGPRQDLLGRSVPEHSQFAPGMSARIERADRFKDVSASGRGSHALVKGVINSGDTAVEPGLVALGLNGTIVGVTRSFIDGGRHRFSVMIDPNSIAVGENEVKVFQVAGRGEEPPDLLEIPNSSLEGSLASVGEGRIGLAAGGRLLKEPPEGCLGGVRLVEDHGEEIRLAGWAGRSDTKEPPEAILVQYDGRVIREEVRFIERPDVARTHGESLAISGFDVVVADEKGSIITEALRIFGVFEGDFGCEIALQLPAP